MKKVFVNGAFDVLHSGHLDLLDFASMLGGRMLVALDTDEKIRYNKGADRPLNNLKVRKQLMSMLKPVDNVVSFNSDEELEDIIKRYKPDVMVKGSDWRGKKIVGEEYCKEVVFFERTNNESTTNTLQDFVDRRRML
jgi:D-beta-D-heptose 7-phosphate kinase/D-beta-D-heptose 1-phosphate adenosyltransferase